MAFHASVRLYAALALSTVSAMPVALHAVAMQAAPASLADTWQGTLHTGKDLRTVVKIAATADGKWSSVFYSIDQGGRPLPVTTTTLRDGDVTLALDAIGGVFTGKLSPDGNTITGVWKQGDGKPLPLILTRATKETAWAIPEPPKPVAPMDSKADPSWDVATIKLSPPEQKGKGFGGPPRHFGTRNTTLNDLITFAYQVNVRQIQGGAAWMETDKFDITTGEPNVPGAPSDDQTSSMMRKLLAERFGLKFHKETQQMSAYVVSVAKGGPKLTATTAAESDGTAFYFPGKLGNLVFRNISMDRFATWMQNGVFDRPVVNHTGVAGRFDGTLKWSPDETQFQIFNVKIVPDESADAPPPITTAMEQQMGLKLSAERTSVEVMIMDHVEKPSDN